MNWTSSRRNRAGSNRSLGRFRRIGGFTKSVFRRIVATDAPAAVLLIQLLVGGVFLSEGIQKFLYPELRGTGRFITLGIPAPEFFGPFVGVFEIVCGTLILLGLLTRRAVIPTIIIMFVAIYTTELPVLQKDGFWLMANRIRLTYSMDHGPIPWNCSVARFGRIDRGIRQPLRPATLAGRRFQPQPARRMQPARL